MVAAWCFWEPGARWTAAAVEMTATGAGDGFVLNGTKAAVEAGGQAAHLLVTARAEAGLTQFLIAADAPGITIKPQASLDLSKRFAEVHFEDVAVADASRLGEEGSGAAVLDRTMDYAAAAAVAEGVGIAATMLQMTVDYLGTREQFGVKIGSFQALQHRAVDMYAESELLRSISMAAMVRADDDDASARRGDISAAKYQLATGGIWVAQQALQLHGGIGATDEHDIGLYFKRMYALNALFGDEEHHVARFASDPAFVESAV